MSTWMSTWMNTPVTVSVWEAVVIGALVLAAAAAGTIVAAHSWYINARAPGQSVAVYDRTAARRPAQRRGGQTQHLPAGYVGRHRRRSRRRRPPAVVTPQGDIVVGFVRHDINWRQVAGREVAW